MKTFALCSGSSGNCFYIENDYGDKVIVDFGISFKKAKEVLQDKNIDINDIDAVFITHEHSDHVRGLNTLLKKVDCQVFMTTGTADALNIINYNKISKNQTLAYKQFNVIVIDKPHDAAEPVCFVFQTENKKIGIFTDIGYLTPVIKDIVKNVDVIYFEANYCINLINDRGSYYIQRCLSDYGHLSTEESLTFIAEHINENQILIFSHISENNNSYENVNYMFKELIKEKKKKIEYYISYQKEPTILIEVK